MTTLGLNHLDSEQRHIANPTRLGCDDITRMVPNPRSSSRTNALHTYSVAQKGPIVVVVIVVVVIVVIVVAITVIVAKVVVTKVSYIVDEF